MLDSRIEFQSSVKGNTDVVHAYRRFNWNWMGQGYGIIDGLIKPHFGYQTQKEKVLPGATTAPCE